VVVARAVSTVVGALRWFWSYLSFAMTSVDLFEDSCPVYCQSEARSVTSWVYRYMICLFLFIFHRCFGIRVRFMRIGTQPKIAIILVNYSYCITIEGIFSVVVLKFLRLLSVKSWFSISHLYEDDKNILKILFFSVNLAHHSEFLLSVMIFQVAT
jgi:hypothetical protein